MFYKRKSECAICGFYIILDLEEQTQSCYCKLHDRLPQWILVDAFQKKRFLENYEPINEAVYLKTMELFQIMRKRDDCH